LPLVKFEIIAKAQNIILSNSKSTIDDFMKEKYKGIPTPRKDSW
jgi:hypothetical protein